MSPTQVPDPHPDDIAVVGVAGIFPGAPDAATFWSNIRAGVDSISDAPATRWDPVYFDPDGKGADRFYTRRGGFVDEVATFDPLAFGIMPVTAETAEPDQLLALSAASAALADAGDVHERLDPSRVAVVLGRGGYLGEGVARLDQRVRTTQQVIEVLRAVVPGISDAAVAQVRAEFQDALGPERPEGAIGLVPNLAASRIANRFDFRGPAYTVDAACASSLIAVDQACDLLRSRRSDLVLAGGVHHCHDLTLWSVFNQLRALSPSGGIRPFSADADGVLIGEGTGVLALRRWADAVADGDRIYAVVRGTGTSSDGRAASPMSPVQAGQVAAVSAAWQRAQLDPTHVGLVEAHGTATALGDRTEIATLREVFGDHGPRVGLGSVKSMIGHAMPAAGAAGLIKAALALHEQVLPPTLHAETVHPDLAGSRFELVRETRSWERPDSGTRLAGVNAFGFGGINAHVVLSEVPVSAAEPVFVGSRDLARDEPSGGASADEQVLLLAGVDAADLSAQLEAAVEAGLLEPGARTPATVPTGGPARLAVVAPDAKRIGLARKVLARGTAFRGRNDVWFDPTGLLRTAGDGAPGKIAFLFPGVEPEFDPQVDDVAERFGLTWEGFGSTDDGLQSQGRGIVNVGRLLAAALERLGVTPDLVAGHSLGEWTGQIVAGIVPPASVDDLLAALRPDALEVPDVVFVAVGAGAEVARSLVEGLPDAHVSHDNCTRQSVICCLPGAVAEVLGRAKERRVLVQELPFRSGFHSPLFAPYARGIEREFGTLPLYPAQVPMWSATTLAPYPDDRESILTLGGRHLVEAVRFRELTQTLYAEGVRAFVQVGSGSLTGFVDDTLRDVDALTVSALAAPGARARTSGLGQLRRAALALWSAGAELDLTLLGHPAATAPTGPPAPTGPTGPAPVPGGRATPLRLGSSLVRNLTPLDLAPLGLTPPSTPSGRHHIGSPGRPDVMTSAGVAGAAGVAGEFAALVREATAAAEEVVRAAASGPGPRAASPVPQVTAPRATPVLPPAPAPARPTPLTPVATAHESVLPLSVAEQPWWADHAFYPQREGWPVLEDRYPLVPLTGLIEMMGDAARALVPGSVVVSITDVRAFRWLAVEPATEARVLATIDPTATARAQAEQSSDTFVVRTTIDGHCRAVVTLARTHPDAPAPAAPPVNGEIPRPWTPETIYSDGHLFHGPAYQGIVSVEAFGIDGAAGRLVAKPFPGSLLDNAGQIFGLWVAARVEKDRLVLPTSVEEFAFFGDHPAPGTLVDCAVTITSIAETFVRANLELTVEGRLWCRITGWEDRRFQSDDRLFSLLRGPGEHLLAEERPGGWFVCVEGWPDSASREVVMRRFLAQSERQDHMSHTPRSQRARLVGRIAAKDAVRAVAFAAGAEQAFPAEVVVRNDDAGRPVVASTLPGTTGLHLSLAHTLGGTGAKVGVGVALVSASTSPGIDVERVAPRSEQFESASFTVAEQALFVASGAAGQHRDRELTRWWAAKEAASKALGTGLQGRPRDFEITQVTPAGTAADPARVELDVRTPEGRYVVATTSFFPPIHSPTATPDVAPNEEYIVAWTER